MIEKVDPESRGINQVVEHWLTWQDDYEKTSRIENEWNAHNLKRMGRQVTGRSGFCGKTPTADMTTDTCSTIYRV